MKYTVLKQKLLDLFDGKKLESVPGEWGFFNEKEREITRLGYAVNLTETTIKAAEKLGVDFLLTHHDSWPFVFGLKDACNSLLIKYGITHAFFHAPLDDAEFGTSVSLAKLLNMYNLKKIMPYADVYMGGVAGEITPLPFDEFSRTLGIVLGEGIRCFQNNAQPIHKIAVAAGGGNMTSEMQIAAEQGCDTYVTGEYALYSQQYAEFAGINLLVGSHTNTEIPGIKSLAQLVCGGTDVESIAIGEPNY